MQGIVENNTLVFKIHGKHTIIKRFFQLYAEFLPHVYQLIGCNMYVELVMDGAIIFFESPQDFAKFHQFCEIMTLPPLPPKKKPSKKDGPVELIVDSIRRPPGISPDELVEGVTKCYQFMSKDIEVEKISDERAIIRYKSAEIFERAFAFLQQFWDQKEESTQFEPKTKFIATAFNFSHSSP